MTGDPIAPDSSVRIIDSDIGKVIPVLDLIRAIGYNRSSVTKTLSRHDEMFKGCKTYQSLDTGRGPQQFLCMNREGVEKLTMLLCPPEVSRPELALKVREFRVKMLDRMTAAMPAIVPAGQPPCGDPFARALRRHADIADILIDRYKYSPEIARSLAMAAVVEEIGTEAVKYRAPAMLPAGAVQDLTSCDKCIGSIAEPDPDYDRYFSVRKLATFTGQSEDQVRNILEKEGLLSWSNGIWHLTTLGQMNAHFGKVFFTYPEWPHRTHERRNIRWSPAALERVKAHLAAGQSRLAEPAG